MMHLDTVPQKPIKVAVELPPSLHDKLEDVLEFVKQTQPEADMKHLIEFMVNHVLKGSSSLMRGYKKHVKKRGSAKPPKAKTPKSSLQDESTQLTSEAASTSKQPSQLSSDASGDSSREDAVSRRERIEEIKQRNASSTQAQPQP